MARSQQERIAFLDSTFKERIEQELKERGQVWLSFIQIEKVLVPIIAETGQIVGGVRAVSVSSSLGDITTMDLTVIVSREQGKEEGGDGIET